MKSAISHLFYSLFVFSLLNSCKFVYSFNFDTEKVVIHRPPYLQNTNFGYTVAGYSVSNDSWIIVGAPLTVRERLYHKSSVEGAIYRCKTNVQNSCYMLPFDKRDDWNEVRDQYGIYYSENKTNQLLGATLKVSNDVVMACAPNYRYVTRILRQDEFRYEPTGICYTLKERMRKFEEYAPCRNSLWGYHRQGFCQAGFSAALTKNSASVVLSGPGAWYWQGMVFSLNLTNKEIRHKYPEKSGEGSDDNSYRGYAVDVGFFDNDTMEDVIASAPRASNYRGYVEIFSSTFKLLHILHGYQMSAYFGYSLTATDLNNDGFDDIVIGSPLYRKDRENFDIGRIDVYIRDKRYPNEYKFIEQKIDGFSIRSRFGNTIAKLGDVNNDGYNDIAVGAPYDETGGTVYIFHGNQNGLNSEPDQIIKGSDYNLKTFGYSLSGSLDLDNNKYPDLIVGAYKSDSVVFLRSRAVVKTNIQLFTTPKVIDLDSRSTYCDKNNKDRICMDLEVCVQYTGKSVPAALRMKLIWELDFDKSLNETSVRAVFNQTGTSVLTQNFTFKYDVKKCIKQTIQLKKTIRDKLTPIRSRLNTSLPSYDSDWELMPVFDSKNQASKIHDIRFLKNCGPDDICIPNLQVSASTPSKNYIYGSATNIDINIQVLNKREDAFESQCIITLPHGVNYVKTFFSQSSTNMPLSCTHIKNGTMHETKIICDIGNPIVSNTGKSFTVRVSPENVLPDQELLTFNITVTSSNSEDQTTLYDNEHYVYVVLDAQPRITLIGKQYQEQVIYDTKKSDVLYSTPYNETQIGPEIIHEYKLIHKGPSEFTSSELIITWQAQLDIDGKSLDYLYLMEAPYLEGPVKCEINEQLINPLNISLISNDRLRNPDRYYDAIRSPSYSQRKKRSFINDYDYINPDKYINCASGITQSEQTPLEQQQSQSNYLTMKDTQYYDFYCASMTCKISTLHQDESSLIRLRFRLWSNNLAIDSEIYSVKTYGKAIVTQIPYSKVNIDMKTYQSTTQIETIAHPKERKNISQPLDLWIIFLSIFAGFVLLVLLIILLWCCGFFKRFEPQELTKLSENMSCEEETVNDVVDISKQLMNLSHQNGGMVTYEKASLITSMISPPKYTTTAVPMNTNFATLSHGTIKSNNSNMANLNSLYSEIQRNKFTEGSANLQLTNPERSYTASTHSPIPINESLVVNTTKSPLPPSQTTQNASKFSTFGTTAANPEILSNKLETFIAYSKANNNINNTSSFDGATSTTSSTINTNNSNKKEEANLAKLPPVPKRSHPHIRSNSGKSNTLRNPSSSSSSTPRQNHYLNQIDFQPSTNNVIINSLNLSKPKSTEHQPRSQSNRHNQIADNMRYGTLKSNAIVCQEYNKPILKTLNTNYEHNL